MQIHGVHGLLFGFWGRLVLTWGLRTGSDQDDDILILQHLARKLCAIEASTSIAILTHAILNFESAAANIFSNWVCRMDVGQATSDNAG